jgi:uncharacterized membrane protein
VPAMPPVSSLLTALAIGAAVVVALGWLIVSFRRPGPGRDRTAWIAAVALYVALLSFFVNLTRRAWERDSNAAIVAFGFLATLFGIGLVLALTKTIAAFRGRVSQDTSTTH